MNGFDCSWYLIYTRPKHEKKVASSLSEAGIRYFLPSIRQVRSWCDRKKCIDSPLFPSYIFVYPTSVQEYFEGLKTGGALYYVRFGDKAARVNELTIEGIRLIVSRAEEIEVSSEYFKPGQKMMIQEGPLTGLSCELVQHQGKDKLLVRVNLLQRSLLATLPSGYVQAVSA